MGCCFACFRNHFKEYYQKKNTEKKKRERILSNLRNLCSVNETNKDSSIMLLFLPVLTHGGFLYSLLDFTGKT